MITISDSVIISDLEDYMEPDISYNIKELLDMLNKKHEATITENELRQLLKSDKFTVLENIKNRNKDCEVILKSGKVVKLPPNHPH